jgi:hypothetical protein
VAGGPAPDPADGAPRGADPAGPTIWRADVVTAGPTWRADVVTTVLDVHPRARPATRVRARTGTPSSGRGAVAPAVAHLDLGPGQAEIGRGA